MWRNFYCTVIGEIPQEKHNTNFTAHYTNSKHRHRGIQAKYNTWAKIPDKPKGTQFILVAGGSSILLVEEVFIIKATCTAGVLGIIRWAVTRELRILRVRLRIVWIDAYGPDRTSCNKRNVGDILGFLTDTTETAGCNWRRTWKADSQLQLCQ